MNNVVAFLLALIPLVVIHEFGHFAMAKLGGIKVTKFCIGFGKKLFGFRFRGTEYCWNLLPLGGYVDFMGELVYTGEIPDDVTHFYNRPKWIRFLVLVMGPLFNLILAFGLYWVYHNIEPLKTGIYLGEPQTVGIVYEEAPHKAGLQVGDRVLAIDGKEISSWDQIDNILVLSPESEVSLLVARGEEEHTVTYTVPADPTEGYGIGGFGPDLNIAVQKTAENSPAQIAGMLPNDLLVSINGQRVSWRTRDRVNRLISDKAPAASTFEISRNGEILTLETTPEKKFVEETQEEMWLVGIHMDYEHTQRDLNPQEALVEAWSSFKRDSTMLYEAVKKLVIGALPLKMLSGPIGVAQAAGDALNFSFSRFILLVALLSLNLGIMNLLPIPVLDGGEIFVLLVEAVARKDFSLDTKMRIKMVGLLFLVALMGFVIVSDIIKVFF